MLAYYRVTDNHLEPMTDPEPGCLVSLIRPDEADLVHIRELAGVSESVLADALDPGERPRLDEDDGIVYAVFRAPWIEGNTLRSDFTSPVTLIFTAGYTVLVDPNGCRSVELYFAGHGAKHMRNTRARIMACLFRTIAERYVSVLRDMNETVRDSERNLGSMGMERQLELLHVQNCLTYFQAALRGNELVMERIQRTRLYLEGALPFEGTDEDSDMFDDTLTDIRQAFYTSQIYADVMKSLMNAHATVISTKVNTIMKILTSLTLVIMLPTLVTSMYGMNVPLPFQEEPRAFLIVISLCVGAAVLAMYIVWKKGWFSSRS